MFEGQNTCDYVFSLAFAEYFHGGTLSLIQIVVPLHTQFVGKHLWIYSSRRETVKPQSFVP